MQVDGKLLAEESLINYSQMAYSSIFGKFDLKLEETEDGFAIEGDRKKVETFQNIFKAILNAISSFDKNIKLMILSGPKNDDYSHIAIPYGVELLYEVFADRNYNDDGTLVSRMHENAVIHDDLDVVDRIVNLKERGYITSIDGKRLFLKADSVCVHGDNDKALDFVRLLRKALI